MRLYRALLAALSVAALAIVPSLVMKIGEISPNWVSPNW